MEPFTKIFNGFQTLTISTKSSNLDGLLGSGYTCEHLENATYTESYAVSRIQDDIFLIIMNNFVTEVPFI